MQIQLSTVHGSRAPGCRLGRLLLWLLKSVRISFSTWIKINPEIPGGTLAATKLSHLEHKETLASSVDVVE